MDTMHFIGPTFALDVPTDWFVVSSPEYQTAFLAPRDAQGRRASFIVAIKPMSKPVTAQQFAELIQQTYDHLDVSREVLDTGEVSLGGVRGYAITSLLSRTEDSARMWQRQVVAVNGDLIYVLVAVRSADLTGPAADVIERSFAAMFDSFAFEEATLPD